MGCPSQVVAKRKREIVDPLHVVNEYKRRTDHPKRTMRGLEDTQRLERRRFLPIAGKEERLQPVPFRRFGGECQQEIGGRCKRHVAFRLVADDVEPVQQRCPHGRLCQQPGLTAARLSHDNGSGNLPGCSNSGDLTKFDQLVPPADERSHLPQRTTSSNDRNGPNEPFGHGAGHRALGCTGAALAALAIGQANRDSASAVRVPM